MSTSIPSLPDAKTELFEFAGKQLTKAELLVEWDKNATLLEEVKAKESELRTLVVKAYIGENVKEGTQKADLANGWILNVQGKINRTIQPDLIAAVTLELKEKFPNVSVEELVNYKPDLKVAAYRGLTDDERKLFDMMMVIKPGTPQVEIKKPKRA